MRINSDCPPFYRSFVPLFLALSFFAIPVVSQETPSLNDAVRQLAEHVATIPNLHPPLRLQYFQDSALAADTGKDWQQSFRKEIEKHRLAVTEDPAANLLRVGLAATPTQLVFSAAVLVEEKDEVRLITFPRSSLRFSSLPVSPVRIEKQLLFQGPDLILDASSFWNGAEGSLILLILRNADLFVLQIDTAGDTRQSISLAGAGVRPSRDPRGELTVHANGASVLLPGKACQIDWSAPAEIKCHAAKSIWRGATTLTPGCDPRGWKLFAGGTDWSTPDLLQVVPEDSSRTGSAALLSDFPGPVLNINSEQSPASALVVTRNLRTGNYEVYKITLACGN